MKDATRTGDFGRRGRLLAGVWAALLALLLLSFGSAYLALGVFNLVASLAIAALKIGLIAACFMHLPRAGAWSRLAVWTALVLLAVLGLLSAFEGFTRAERGAAWQAPAKIAPAVPQPAAASR